MSKLEAVESRDAPAAVGPYSQAIVSGDLVFTSGGLPIDPAAKAMPEDVKDQARQVLTNLKAVLAAAGTGMDKVVKATVFLADIKDFAAVNEVYASFFAKPFPARSCCQVSALPMGARVEIELIATK
ncbi:MAG: RidA family protein [Planctomycetota bacterium]|jgi:2-iminobutanoate/2-iminopropanoate deaminase|nr:RidA family protein [Planctomycetota bacterium]